MKSQAEPVRSSAGGPSPGFRPVRARRRGPVASSRGARARWGSGPRERGVGAGERRGGAGGRAAGGQRRRGRWKRPFEFPSMLPLLSSPLAYFFLHSLGAVLSRPERSHGFLGCWHLVVQRPSHRSGVNTLHLSLDASRDDSQHACERQPHRYDGLLRRAGILTDHLHQH